MIYNQANTYNNSFTPFHLYPKASDRKIWSNLPTSYTEPLLEEAARIAHVPIEVLPASLFRSYSTHGNRVDYETLYFDRRARLATLILAESILYDGRYLLPILDGLWAICEESAWQLPAHNNYERDMPVTSLPDVNRPVLDLFACETGAFLATAYYLLHDAYVIFEPRLLKRIKDELYKRIVKPYLTQHFWWMGNGLEPMNNWTIWCTQNILLTSFLTPQDTSTQREIFYKACKSIDYFLEEYGQDGCCDEGPQYYRHAGLCLYTSLSLLNHVTDGHFESIYSMEKIKNIASYICYVRVNEHYSINYADCAAAAGPLGVREYLFAEACHLDNMRQYATKDYYEDTKAGQRQLEDINLYDRLQGLFNYSRIKADYADLDLSHMPIIEDHYYDSVGLLIARDTHYVFAAKAGNNDDSHNHNDTGSITLYKDEKPFLVDVGVENYTKKTFSSERYTLWAMQSDYHNLPTICHTMQDHGPNAKATDVFLDLTDTDVHFDMMLTDAYPVEGLLHYHRTLHFQKEKGILLKDTFDFHPDADVSVILNFMTYEKPILENNQIHVGDLGTLTVASKTSFIAIETIPIQDSRLALSWKHPIYRIRITLDEPYGEIYIQ